MILDRKLPFDTDAESAVLCSVLLFPECYDAVSLEVRADDFYDIANQTLYANMARLRDANKPIDLTLLIHELKAEQLYETIGGAANLAKIAAASATPSNAVYYARIIREHSIRRKAIQAASEVLTNAYEASGPAIDLIGTATGAFADIGEAMLPRKQGGGHIGELLIRAMDDLDLRSKGKSDRHKTGLCGIDRIIGGLKKQQFVVVGARPGQGKTSMLLRIAANMATGSSPLNILFITLEMGESDLSERLLSMLSKVNSWKLQSGTMNNQDRQDLVDAAARINKSKLWVEDPGTITVSQIAAMCRLQARRHGGLDMLVIDYVQLIEPESVARGESRQQQLGKITRKLKQLAKNQDLIVLSAAQLNRDVDRSGREPRLSDLREAGDIEQDTDVVMMCHLPGAENDAKRPKSTEEGEDAKVLVRKNRNGPTGETEMYYFRAFSLWGDQGDNAETVGQKPAPARFSEFDEWNTEGKSDGYGKF